MSTMETTRECGCCGQALNASGRCVNVDCERAAMQATRGASRSTAKAAAGYARVNEPRAFSSSGRVD